MGSSEDDGKSDEAAGGREPRREFEAHDRRSLLPDRPTSRSGSTGSECGEDVLGSLPTRDTRAAHNLPRTSLEVEDVTDSQGLYPESFERQDQGENIQDITRCTVQDHRRCCCRTVQCRPCHLLLAMLSFLVIIPATVLYYFVGISGERVRQPSHLDQCKKFSNTVTQVLPPDQEPLGLRHCEEQAKNGADTDLLMDPPLDASIITTKEADVFATWTVSRDCLPSEDCQNKSVTFGSSSWLYPRDLKAENDVDRVVFVHGCGSNCDVNEPIYTAMTTRLAHYYGMPVLVANFGTEPEYPWPDNALSVLQMVRYAAHTGPLSGEAARNIFLVADSEGSLVAFHAMALMTNESALPLLGVPVELHSSGDVQLAGLVLFSPAVDVQCISPTLHTNCWDDGTGKVNKEKDPAERGRSGPMSFRCDATSHEERIQDCLWSYVQYFFGYQAVRNVRTRLQAEFEYRRHSLSFWQSPLVNAYTFDFSSKGVPPVFVSSGSLEFFAGDAQMLVERICASKGDVTFFFAKDMWHDFQEWSEGCRGNVSIPEGIEAYRRSAAWIRGVMARRRVFPVHV